VTTCLNALIIYWPILIQIQNHKDFMLAWIEGALIGIIGIWLILIQIQNHKDFMLAWIEGALIGIIGIGVPHRRSDGQI
jgi:inner membrane protein involved in colicin E2 resistance